MALNRYRAFGLHVLCSLTIGLLSAAMVFLVWYPYPLAMASGVTTIFLMMLGIDVVLGPCITLVIFNPAKKPMKELRRDLLIVVVIQLSALGYGLYSVFVPRPAYVVYGGDSFFKVAYANDFLGTNYEWPSDRIHRKPPVFGPELVGARVPDFPEKVRQQVKDLLMIGGQNAFMSNAQSYVPYDQVKPAVIGHLKPLEDLRRFNPERGTEIDRLIARYSGRVGGVGYVLLMGKVKMLSVIVARDTGDVLEISALAPQ